VIRVNRRNVSSVVAIVGDEHSDFESVLKEIGVDYDVLPIEELESGNLDRYGALVICAASYPKPMHLSEPMLQKLRSFLDRGKNIYCEYSNFLDLDVGAPRVAGLERIIVRQYHYITQDLSLAGILEEHESMFLPVTAKGGVELLSYCTVVGTYRSLHGIPEDSCPALLFLSVGKGKVIYVSSSFSRFKKRRYLLTKRWEALARRILLFLLPDEQRKQAESRYIDWDACTEPRRWVAIGEPVSLLIHAPRDIEVSALSKSQGPLKLTRVDAETYRKDMRFEKPGIETFIVEADNGVVKSRKAISIEISDRRQKYLETLKRNIRWFESSGVLPVADGSDGVMECVQSPIDVKGEQKVARVVVSVPNIKGNRADCNFESAYAFYLYGKIIGDKHYKQVSLNILRRLFNYQSLDEKNPTYGLWATRGNLEDFPILRQTPWEDDISWITKMLLAFYDETGDTSCLKQGLLTSEVQMEVGAPISAAQIIENGRTPYYNRQNIGSHPHAAGTVIAALLYAHGLTGDSKYLAKARLWADYMIETFPQIRSWVISRTCEASRYLLPISLLYYYTQEEKYKRALFEVANNFLLNHQVACGAIQEWDNSRKELAKPGLGDVGVFHDNGEPISDQLYCTSFASMNLWIAYKATGEKIFLDRFLKLTDYLVRIQIESDYKVIDGGWMRAFDFEDWEYYGSNADTWWGPYCMETGWSNSIIDIAIALFLLDDPFFPTETKEKARRTLGEIRSKLGVLNSKWDQERVVTS
jgi:hypothetical protein